MDDDVNSPLFGMSQRMPPSNVPAEQALLGALLANNKAFDRVSEFLLPEHFADAVNGRIFEAIQRRCERDQIADPVTLRAELEHSGVLDEVGGLSYLAQLLTATVGIINAGEYGRVIRDAWLRRQLIDLGEVVVNRAFGLDPELTGEKQIEAAEQELFDLTARETNEGPQHLNAALVKAIETAEEALRHGSAVTGLSTGLRDLNAKTGGLHPSDLIILAGRPGMGKTALATKIAWGAAKSLWEAALERGENVAPDQGVAIFSLEMSADQLATRLLAEMAKVPGNDIRRGKIEQRQFDRFVEASKELGALPIYIDDTPALTLSALRTRCRRLARKYPKGLALIVIDYLQLMRPAEGTRPENRVLEISQITQGLKALAKSMKVPVMALSQLSRAVESREDKRPQLADLRESGSIEQDADAVMFVYRDEYYLAQRIPKQMNYPEADKFNAAMAKWEQDMEAVHNIAELSLVKQRHGPTGTIKLMFEGEYTRFADLDLTHSDPHGG